MKTKEELNALKEEVEAVSRKLLELTEEELAQAAGGANSNVGLFVSEKGFGFIPPEEGGRDSFVHSADIPPIE